jgi:uncharacterized protein (DUF302 family)
MKNGTYYITKKYQGDFSSALTSMVDSLNQEGFGILTQIDVQETLEKKLNIDYPKYMILGACNPPNAYKALQAEKEIGLLLPCNVIIYEENGSTFISIMKPTAALTLSSSMEIAKIAGVVEAKLVNALNMTVNEKGDLV